MRNCAWRACDSGVKSSLELEMLCHCSQGSERAQVGWMKEHVFECPLVCGIGDSRKWACVRWHMCPPSGGGKRPGGRHWWWRWWLHNYVIATCVSYLSCSLLSLSLIGTPWSCDLMLYFSSPSLRQLRLRCVSLWDWRSSVCVYTNMCGNRETDSVQFTGPASGCVRKCWNGNAISYARRREGSGNKTERQIERGRQRQFDKARENERSRETKRNKKSKVREAGKGYWSWSSHSAL